MKPTNENQRDSVTTDFQESLQELEDIIQPSSTKKPENSPKKTDKVDKLDKIDLAAWEDAVADIEQYLQDKVPESSIEESQEETEVQQNPS